MSDDQISRQQAIDALESDYAYAAAKIIKNLPPAQPERKNGRWVNEQMDYGECSECGFYGMTTDFCPNCGADMTEGEG